MAAKTGAPPPVDQLAARRPDVIQPLPSSGGATASEQPRAAQFDGRSPTLFRRKGQVSNTVTSTVLSVAAAMAIAFIVLQCYKFVATNKRPPPSSLGPPERPGTGKDSCGVSEEYPAESHNSS
ncbi:hypothetical protein ACSSS7_001418 [Eimeria intestinalis]